MIPCLKSPLSDIEAPAALTVPARIPKSETCGGSSGDGGGDDHLVRRRGRRRAAAVPGEPGSPASAPVLGWGWPAAARWFRCESEYQTIAPATRGMVGWFWRVRRVGGRSGWQSASGGGGKPRAGGAVAREP